MYYIYWNDGIITEREFNVKSEAKKRAVEIQALLYALYPSAERVGYRIVKSEVRPY